MLLSALVDFFKRHPQVQRFHVAYSGGLDSQVLLSACLFLQKQFNFNLQAIHINHQINKNSSQWAAHCAAYCERQRIAFLQQTISVVKAKGASLEQVARDARYAVFADCLQADEMLLTAHHLDDQAETTLLQLLRGSGPKGLAAMPECKAFAKGYHARPLLTVPRQALYDYAMANQLSWVEDDSNSDTTYTRNFLRHCILPELRTRFESAASTIARAAAHCAESQALLEEFGLTLLEKSKHPISKRLLVSRLLTMSPSQQRFVMRLWIEQNGFLVPDTKKLQTICEQMLTAANDRSPCVRWGNAYELRRFQDELYLRRSQSQSHVPSPLQWQLPQTLNLPGVGVLCADSVSTRGLRLNLPPLQVRFRQGGEKLDCPDRGRLALKNLFQEWQVPPWLRGQIPLLFLGEECIAVVGYFLNKNYLAGEGERGYLPVLI